jgi:hypothetical protein
MGEAFCFYFSPLIIATAPLFGVNELLKFRKRIILLEILKRRKCV